MWPPREEPACGPHRPGWLGHGGWLGHVGNSTKGASELGRVDKAFWGLICHPGWVVSRDVVSDEVWAVIGPLFPQPAMTGRPPVDRPNSRGSDCVAVPQSGQGASRRRVCGCVRSVRRLAL